MAIVGDALRQTFMPKQEFDNLREEKRVSSHLRNPLLVSIAIFLGFSVLVSAIVSLRIVFPSEPTERPFCHERSNPAIVAGKHGGAFHMTEEETADFYWMVVFIPSAIVFFASIIYLLSGIAVAYSAPRRHFSLWIVENSFCTSKRGGVHCLSLLNAIFALVFALMAIFLGSSLLSLEGSCSVPLFWCYEIASWSLVVLHGGTAFSLGKKSTSVVKEEGLEMLVTPEMEMCINEGFKSWMGPSLLSSDDEDDEKSDDYLEHGVVADNSFTADNGSGLN